MGRLRALAVRFRLRLLGVRQRVGLALAAIPIDREDALLAARLLVLAALATGAVAWAAYAIVLFRAITGYG